MSNFFSKCNMVMLEEITIRKGGEDIKLPLLFHIKDVSATTDTIEDNLIFFNDNNNEEDKKYILIELLEKVNLPLLVYNENLELFFDSEGLKQVNMKQTPQGYVFSNHESLYNFLININFNENDFAEIQSFIIDTNDVLINNFKNMVDQEIKTGERRGIVTEGFMCMRIAMENSHVAIFPENLNRSVSEYSFRENVVKRAYIGRKIELEEIARKKAKEQSR